MLLFHGSVLFVDDIYMYMYITTIKRRIETQKMKRERQTGKAHKVDSSSDIKKKKTKKLFRAYFPPKVSKPISPLSFQSWGGYRH